jgi:magnesium transporter
VRKIKYKKGRKVQPSFLEYTGSHKQVKAELQLFVYDTNTLTEFNESKVSQLD